jgi:hypothetical protein
MHKMTDLGTAPVLRPGGTLELLKQNHVAVTASICLVALVVAMKNILVLAPDVLARDTMLYSIIYLGFLTMAVPNLHTASAPQESSPVFWDLLIVGITLAVIAVYAL